MSTFLLALCLLLLSMGGLAASLFFGRAPITGSCGGLNCADGSQCACGKREKP